MTTALEHPGKIAGSEFRLILVAEGHSSGAELAVTFTG